MIVVRGYRACNLIAKLQYAQQSRCLARCARRTQPIDTSMGSTNLGEPDSLGENGKPSMLRQTSRQTDLNTYVHMYIRLHIRTCMHACMHRHTQTHLHACIDTHTYVCTYVRACMHACTDTHTHLQLHACIHRRAVPCRAQPWPLCHAMPHRAAHACHGMSCRGQAAQSWPCCGHAMSRHARERERDHIILLSSVAILAKIQDKDLASTSGSEPPQEPLAFGDQLCHTLPHGVRYQHTSHPD